MGSVPAHCAYWESWSGADLLRQFTFRNVHLVDVAHMFLVLCQDPTCEGLGNILSIPWALLTLIVLW